MKELTDEILKRFPEVEASVFEGDDELPYLMMGHVADWVLTQVGPPLAPGIVNRVVDFCSWCTSHPRGDTAADDILTIWTVGFYEKMLENEATHPLIPEIVTKQELINNREYLVNWVGQDAYVAALKRYR